MVFVNLQYNPRVNSRKPIKNLSNGNTTTHHPHVSAQYTIVTG
jgi:hypothetical protein